MIRFIADNIVSGKNKSRKYAGIFLFLISLSLSSGFSQGTIRILPLGNSITYGNMCVNGSIGDCVPISGSDAPGYRYRLYELLTNAGWSIDFIGSENSGSNYLSDTNNAGFGGISDDNLATLMETGSTPHQNIYRTPGPYMETYSADIVLLHIGTNDVLGADTSNVNGVKRILDAIDDYENSSGNPVMVFLSRIISYRDYQCNTQPRVMAYNSKIEQLASSRIAAGDNLILVDMECDASLDYFNDMEDEVHPNQNGYNKMGEHWFESVDSYLRSIYIRYTITASASGNGSIDPSGSIELSEGEDQSFTITPDAGFKISDVLVDGSSVGAVSEYTFNNITANHSISVSFEPITYNITALEEGNGTIDPSGTVIVNEGDDQTFNIIPDQNHQITNVLVNGSSVGAVSSFEFTNVTADQSIQAIFGPITHTISASAGANGSIDPEGSLIVNQGTDQSFAITPDEGFEVEEVTVDGSSVGSVESYTFSNVTSDHSIEVSFRIKNYQITTSVSGNGTINPEGPVSVEHGSGQFFSFAPGDNHQISDVLVNGSSVGAVSSYELVNVSSDQAIEVIFSPVTYTITATAVANGSISPTGSVAVEHGADQEFIIAPDEGYEVLDVLIDGVSTGVVESYTFSNVTSDHDIEVSFKIKTYQITTSVTGNGNVSPEGPLTIEHGTDQTFNFSPDANYRIADVMVDGASVGKVSVYTLNDITADHSISVVFELITTSINNHRPEKQRAIHSLYPNPSNGDFSLFFNGKYSFNDDKVTLRIFDNAGKLVYFEEFKVNEILQNDEKQISIGDKNLEGIYYLEVVVGREKEVVKLIFGK